VDAGEARIQGSEGKPKSGNQRPTLAKTALGWGTLKFRYARTQHWVAFADIGNTR
jgi:hypothetical protein